jgi:hypothetical protein
VETIYLGDRRIQIRTSVLEEKSTACNMLCCYADELKEGFLPWVQQVRAVLPQVVRGLHLAVPLPGRQLHQLWVCAASLEAWMHRRMRQQLCDYWQTLLMSCTRGDNRRKRLID